MFFNFILTIGEVILSINFNIYVVNLSPKNNIGYVLGTTAAIINIGSFLVHR